MDGKPVRFEGERPEIVRVPLYWWDISLRAVKGGQLLGYTGLLATAASGLYFAYYSFVPSPQGKADRMTLQHVVGFFVCLTLVAFFIELLRAAPKRDTEKDADIVRLGAEVASLQAKLDAVPSPSLYVEMDYGFSQDLPISTGKRATIYLTDHTWLLCPIRPAVT